MSEQKQVKKQLQDRMCDFCKKSEHWKCLRMKKGICCCGGYPSIQTLDSRFISPLGKPKSNISELEEMLDQAAKEYRRKK